MTDPRELTPLERAIADVKAGFAERTAILLAFASSRVVVPTATADVKDMADLQPLLFETPGGPMLAVFTHLDMIGEYSERARFALEVPGSAVLQSLAPGTGLVVNPGRPSGFDLTPEGVADLRRGLGLPDPQRR